jgi:hypothetical protein
MNLLIKNLILINMVKKINRYIFVLNVDVEKIDKKYDIKIISNIIDDEDFVPNNTTKLSELPVEKGCIDIVSFLDESKKLHKCTLTMIDFNMNKKLEYSDSYNCFWCRHHIDTLPLGCPISYVSNTAVKKYYSEISKDHYTIKENITKHKIIESDKIDTLEENFFFTDGVFCSFNCIIAFILDNKRNKLYDNSIMLTTKMYNNINGTAKISITPAPHWRLLNEYGGNLTITEFRNSFNKIEYDNFGTVKNLPEFHSIGTIYEKKLKF